MNVHVTSEIGRLNGVIIHTPGKEVENMTPQNAERALYSDILNLSVAAEEYSHFKAILQKVTKTFELRVLLQEVLQTEESKNNLIESACENEDAVDIKSELLKKEPKELTAFLIEGLPLKVDTLTKYFSEERYSLQPLHNFFFTRDSAIALGEQVLIARMNSKVREREAIIMEHIFRYHPEFNIKTTNPISGINNLNDLSIEGGDILVARDDIIIIGKSIRTSSQGIDYLIDRFKEQKVKKHIIVQELPHSPESFIHLDMVFTFLDKDKCMLYDPVILNQHDFQTVHISIDNGSVSSIVEEKNIIQVLAKLGIELEPIFCGGEDPWNKEREQWHSGANFFAVAPGIVMGYGRNTYTMDELYKHGFEIKTSKEILKNNINPLDYKLLAIALEGAELSRGGGGCRCMTLPFNRDSINF